MEKIALKQRWLFFGAFPTDLLIFSIFTLLKLFLCQTSGKQRWKSSFATKIEDILKMDKATLVCYYSFDCTIIFKKNKKKTPFRKSKKKREREREGERERERERHIQHQFD